MWNKWQGHILINILLFFLENLKPLDFISPRQDLSCQHYGTHSYTRYWVFCIQDLSDCLKDNQFLVIMFPWSYTNRQGMISDYIRTIHIKNTHCNWIHFFFLYQCHLIHLSQWSINETYKTRWLAYHNAGFVEDRCYFCSSRFT